jgi:hypothetical protein
MRHESWKIACPLGSVFSFGVVVPIAVEVLKVVLIYHRARSRIDEIPPDVLPVPPSPPQSSGLENEIAVHIRVG